MLRLPSKTYMQPRPRPNLWPRETKGDLPMAEAATKLPVKTDKSVAPAEHDWMSFDSLRREVDRLFDDFWPFGWRLPSRRASFELDIPKALGNWSVNPAFDLVEKDKEYEITAELPGIDEKNVEIKLSNHLLTIKGEKSESKEEKQKDYYLSERRFGSFQRSFQVPDGVDGDKIEATFAKGLLTVRLPKTAEARNAEKRISVKAA
jgi:HSP20 family protein